MNYKYNKCIDCQCNYNEGLKAYNLTTTFIEILAKGEKVKAAEKPS